jgi:hypothetical protein
MPPAETLTQPVAVVASPHRPALRTIVRHVAWNVFASTVLPAALFALCLMVGNLILALASALAWCYGAVFWRMGTGRRTSGLLWLSLLGLTVKTVVALSFHSTLIYYLQPAVGTAVVAAVFLASLSTARPVVAYLAADFYPMDDDLHGRPRVQRLFWRLTLLWAILLGAQATLSLALLPYVSVRFYAEMKTVMGPSAAILGAAVTIMLSAQVARLEGLLPVHGHEIAGAGA